MSLRIGLIGCGAWGRHILRDLKDCGTTVHVLAKSEASRRNAVEQRADSVLATLADMPFVQFHPTTLYLPGANRALITEAVRGEGAHLLDDSHFRFMLDVASRLRSDIIRRSLDLGSSDLMGRHQSQISELFEENVNTVREGLAAWWRAIPPT